MINNITSVKEKELVFFERVGDYITLESSSDSTILILNGEPINEPIVGQGPFFMNTQEEIDKAFMDYRTGHF